MLVNKAVKLAEAFKYGTASVPLSVAIPKSTPRWVEKALLRNYIISLPKSSSPEYPRDVKWVVDGLAAIRSVPPPTIYEEWFKTLVIFITPPAEA